MATLDYKIVEEREVNGEIVYQRVKFFSGDITTADELDIISGETKSVTRLRRNEMVEEVEYNYG